MQAKINPISTIFDNVHPYHVKYSPDGHFIFCFDPSEVHIWDTTARKQLTNSIPSGISAFSPDGNILIIASYQEPKVYAYSTQRFEKIAEFSTSVWGRAWERLLDSDNQRIRVVEFSPTGEYIIIGRSDGKVTVLSWPLFKEISTISIYQDSELYDLGVAEK
jgi:WD40 repeat protein